MNTIHLSDAAATDHGQRWELSTAGLSVTYRFDRDFGIILEQFTNLAGERPVHYITAQRSALPFTIQVDGKGNPLPFLSQMDDRWILEESRVFESSYGGRPVLELSVTVFGAMLRVTLHAVAFPGTSVLRQWFTIHNCAVAHGKGVSISPLTMVLTNDDYKNIYHAYTLRGGNANYNMGELVETVLGPGRTLPVVDMHSEGSSDYTPLVVLTREDSPKDGLMIELDYTARWTMYAGYRYPGGVDIRVAVDPNSGTYIAPESTVQTPVLTFAAYTGVLDNLMQELYDWQYEYMWDYANDYFGKIRFISMWVYCSRNLHEQFIYRSVTLPMSAREGQKQGYEVFWDDAGWSAYPGWPIDSYGSVFANNYEGNDFRIPQRFYKKIGMKWLAWFAGHPSHGILETKAGAWGVYEWRTDGMGNADLNADNEFRSRVKGFLDRDLRRSFHTCNGGSTYSHTFDIQRYANYHYFADYPAGPIKTYNFSYFDVPERWGDITTGYTGSNGVANDGGSGVQPPEITVKEKTHNLDNSLDEISTEGRMYQPEFARSQLVHIPMPSNAFCDEDREAVRVDMELYDFFRDRGIAGRWSYMFHPETRGERSIFVMQRMSHDKKRGCIILRRRPRGVFTVYPAGLLPEEQYTVSFQNCPDTFTRTGAQLYDQGIRMEKVTDGELIYLNLPDRPGAGWRKQAPAAPVTAVKLLDNALGCTGIGVYWSPAKGEDEVKRYEISRNGELIGEVSVGSCFFDWDAADIDAQYCVRGVDRDGNRSDWRQAAAVASVAEESYSAMGVFGEKMPESGWLAETSQDLLTFAPMSFIPPEKAPYADFGGTPNQTGGIEGWWVGGKCAKVGHGWMQASSDCYTVRTFICPHAGTVTVGGRATKEWYHQNEGCDLQAAVLHGTALTGGWKTLARGDLYGADWNEKLQVEKGDLIRFVLAPAAEENEQTCPWEHGANLVGWIPVVRYTCAGETENAFAAAEGGKGGKLTRKLQVPDGVYSLKLCMHEDTYRFSGERRMRLSVCGRVLEQELDIMHLTRGGGVLEKVYNSIVPENGVITVELEGLDGVEATLDSVRAASEQRDHIRINCGSDRDFVDWAGDVWQADRWYVDGEALTARERTFRQASPTLYDRGLYFNARTGNEITYRIPVRQGMYSVQLKFAELWLDTPGYRRMDVFVGGRQLRRQWDPLGSAGMKDMSADMRVDDIEPEDGFITVTVRAVGTEPAILQAIEVE